MVLVILQTSTWDTLTERVRAMASSVGEGAVSLLLAIAVGLIAWGIAFVVATGARAILRAARFNDGARSLFGAGSLGRAHEPAALVSRVVYWALIVTGLVFALDTLGFDLGHSVTDRLRDVLPRIIAAMLLFAFGVLLAMLLGAVTRRFFEGMGVTGARWRGQVVAFVLSAFAALLALEQLGLAAQFIVALGVTAVAALGLALGLAFGLGCRDLARDFVVEYLRSLEDETPGRQG